MAAISDREYQEAFDSLERALGDEDQGDATANDGLVYTLLAKGKTMQLKDVVDCFRGKYDCRNVMNKFFSHSSMDEVFPLLIEQVHSHEMIDEFYQHAIGVLEVEAENLDVLFTDDSDPLEDLCDFIEFLISFDGDADAPTPDPNKKSRRTSRKMEAAKETSSQPHDIGGVPTAATQETEQSSRLRQMAKAGLLPFVIYCQCPSHSRRVFVVSH